MSAPEAGELVAKVGEIVLENPVAEYLGAPVIGALAGGALLGTAVNEASGHALSKVYEEAVLDGLLSNEPTAVPTPEGQTDHPNGFPGHWVQDPNTPDIDATFVQDGE